MLAEQLVGHQVGRQVVVLMEGADPDARDLRTRVDPGQFRRGGGEDRLAEARVGRNAALKVESLAGLPVLPVQGLAEEVDLGDSTVAGRGRRRGIADFEAGDNAIGDRARRAQLDQGADLRRVGQARVLFALPAVGGADQYPIGLGARHGDDVADFDFVFDHGTVPPTVKRPLNAARYPPVIESTCRWANDCRRTLTNAQHGQSGAWYPAVIEGAWRGRGLICRGLRAARRVGLITAPPAREEVP